MARSLILRASLFGFALLSLFGARAWALDASPSGNPVRIEFFFEPGCDDCDRVRSQVLPDLDRRFRGQVTRVDRDLGELTNYARLVQLQQKEPTQLNAHVFLAVEGGRLLQGYDEISRGIGDAVAGRLAGTTAQAVPDPRAKPGDRVILERLAGFRWAGVAVAGLADGLNPCAFSTLVFFMSLLSVARVRGRMLLLVGGFFCLASFLTYFALGLGLLRVLHLLDGFQWVRAFFEWAMVGVLLVLAALSFRDARRFAARQDPNEVVLQMPETFRHLTHRLLKRGMAARHLLAAAFGLGVVVTALESVCTGQLYVPTLVFMMKSEQMWNPGLPLLILYNLCFILPLVAVFGLTCAGLQFAHLMNWSIRNVVISKILLGLLFLGMAGLMLGFVM
jgi:hypothetical protein